MLRPLHIIDSFVHDAYDREINFSVATKPPNELGIYDMTGNV